MINGKRNPVEWSTLSFNLIDAKEHLENLLKQMETVDFDEVEFGTQIGHIYEHLNRAWNTRNLGRGYSGDEWVKLSKFPTDIIPGDMGSSPVFK